jgi:uncharacterized protein YceK
MKNLMLLLSVCVAMAGCATSSKVTYDYDTTANFSAMKTFNWMPATGNAVADELLVKRIKNAVDVQLQAKGHTLAADNPDFNVAMEVSGKTTYGGSTGVGMSVGIPVGRGTVSVGGGKSKAREKTEGTLVLDILDTKTRTLVWRATATAPVESGYSPEEQQLRINEMIAEMLSQFPPKKK